MTAYSVSLYYKDYRSDKEYHLQINQAVGTGGRYTVTARYGPRGGTLTHVDLTKGMPVSWYDAKVLFEKKENEKRAKGYKENGRAELIKRLDKELSFVLSATEWNELAKWIEQYVEEKV